MLTTRRGTTLLELLVGMSLLGAVGGIALRIVMASAWWTEASMLRGERHAQLEASRSVVVALLAAAAPGEGDMTRMNDTAVVWRATVAHGVACRISGAAVIVPMGERADGLALGGGHASPQPGDVLVAFDDAASPAPSDDRWTTHTVNAVAGGPGACSPSPLVHSSLDSRMPAWVMQVSPPLDSMRRGSPVRVLRPSRLALYRSATEWALGASEQTPAGPWSGIQPVAGPLEPPGRPGLRLRWMDGTGAAATTPALVEVHAAAAMRRTGRGVAAGAARGDSVRRLLALRNRR